MGTAEHPVPHRVKLRAERQSVRMSKIINDGLTRSGTGCFTAVPMATVGVKGLTNIWLASESSCALCLTVNRPRYLI